MTWPVGFSVVLNANKFLRTAQSLKSVSLRLIGSIQSLNFRLTDRESNARTARKLRFISVTNSFTGLISSHRTHYRWELRTSASVFIPLPIAARQACDRHHKAPSTPQFARY